MFGGSRSYSGWSPTQQSLLQSRFYCWFYLHYLPIHMEISTLDDVGNKITVYSKSAVGADLFLDEWTMWKLHKPHEKTESEAWLGLWMVDLDPKCFRLTSTGINPKLYQIRFPYNLARSEIWSEKKKTPDLSNLGPIRPALD